MSDLEGQDKPETEKRPYAYFEATAVVAKIHHFYISDTIIEPFHYIEMIHAIRHAGPSDVVYIHINCAGGHLATGAQIIAAMKATEAHVVTIIEGEAYSLATMIFLSGDEMLIHENSIFMIHNHSGGFQGKGNEYLAQAAATSKWYEGMCNTVYAGFLTKEEIKRMLKGEDFWLTSDQVKVRLDKFVKYLERKQAREAEND